MATREEKAGKRYGSAADREIHSLDEGPKTDGRKPSEARMDEPDMTDAHGEERKAMVDRHLSEVRAMHSRHEKEIRSTRERHNRPMGEGEEKSVEASQESPTKEA